VAPLFDARDVDALYAARFVEPTMFLLVHLAYGRKLGQVGAWLLRRQDLSRRFLSRPSAKAASSATMLFSVGVAIVR
jgi:hypothetical protein